MNLTLTTNTSPAPSQQETAAAAQSVTRYFIRCGIRDSGFIRDQSHRIVSSKLTAMEASEDSPSEFSTISDSGSDTAASLERSVDSSSSFQQQCLQEATIAMQDLLDKSTQLESTQEACIRTKQFAFLGTDDLLFTTHAFHQDPTNKPQPNDRMNQRVAMVIPPAKRQRFRKNSTPALVGPLRLTWWTAVLTSWIPKPRKIVSESVQGKRLAPKLQTSQTRHG